MLKIKKDGRMLELEMGGSVKEICIDLCCAITAIHQRIGQDGADLTEMFRLCMVAAVTEPESPVWKPLENATIIEIDKDALGKGGGQ